ncbi:hypothetical protein CRYUN_Cryun05aG0028100 [Craigia yunnanensis]
MVIHLQAPFKQIGSSSSCQQIESSSSCEKCGYKRDHCNGGIIKTCLDCFHYHHPLQFYEYGVSFAELKRSRRGTCSVFNSKPPHEVIKIATDFLEKKSGFGRYDVFANNCEEFAMYCKIGTAFSFQVYGHITWFKLIPGAGLIYLGAYGLAKIITNAQRRPCEQSYRSIPELI